MSKEIQEAFRHLGPALIGTVDVHGMPNISPRFILDIPDDGSLIYGDNFQNKTYENLQAHPQVTAFVADFSSYSGYQVKGHVETYTSGPYYETVKAGFLAAGFGNRPVQAVRIVVEEIYQIKPEASSKHPIG